jgi:hypothetical protein
VAKTSTLAEMRDRVRFLGDFPNSRKFTPAIIDREVNNAVEDTWNVLITARPDYYTLEQLVTSVAGTDSVALAGDFFRLRKVEMRDGARWRPLLRVELNHAHRFSDTQGRPTHYRLQGTTVKLYRTPDGAYDLRVFYMPCKSTLVADGDTFDGINGFEEHAVVGAVVKLKMREGMPAEEWVGERRRLEQDVRSHADNMDSGQPFYLSGSQRGELADDWGGELP